MRGDPAGSLKKGPEDSDLRPRVPVFLEELENPELGGAARQPSRLGAEEMTSLDTGWVIQRRLPGPLPIMVRVTRATVGKDFRVRDAQRSRPHTE